MDMTLKKIIRLRGVTKFFYGSPGKFGCAGGEMDSDSE